jgi:hypothetical protein
MGFMQQGSGNPYAALDKQGVIGMLKATGSKDPDVLHAQRQILMAQAKHLRTYAILAMAGGGICTITIVLAIFGIPLALVGWWIWRRASQNLETIEAAWTEYMGTVRV